MSDPTPGPLPIFRAVVLTVVVAVHALAAAPLPQVVTPYQLRNPVSAEEVRRWSERLGVVGIHLTPEALGQRVVSVTGVIGGAHRAAMAPFRPLFRLTGTGQGWALFANPDTHPERLVIKVRDAQGWRILYRRLDPEHAWGDAWLSYRRVRALGDSGGYRARPTAAYDRFARWMGGRVLEAMPDVDAVAVEMVRTHTTLPGDPPDPRTEVRHTVTTARTRP